MFIGVLQFELVVPGSRSLKDKRRVIKSLKDRLHREHLVSIAEIEALDHQRLAVMGLTCVSNSTTHINGVLDRVLDKLRALHDARLGDVSRDILHGDHLPTPAPGTGTDAELWREDEGRDGNGADA